MSSDRIPKEYSEIYPLPPYSWYWRKSSALLEYDIIKNNIHKVALNKPLMVNLKKEDVKNPLLFTSLMWPIVGSQRLRAIHEIRKSDHNFDPLLHVAVFDKPYENIWKLWGDQTFANKSMSIQYQMWELVFKSQWYTFDKTESGVDMKYYENIGDELPDWEYKVK